MTAKDDYRFITAPLLMHDQYEAMCDEIDRLRAKDKTIGVLTMMVHDLTGHADRMRDLLDVILEDWRVEDHDEFIRAAINGYDNFIKEA